MQEVSKEDVLKAQQVLADKVTHTPLQYDRYLSEKYACQVYLKREDLQKVRSFKLRGAYYAIKSLSEKQIRHGVVCASAGNHAQGVAYTCNEMGVPAVIFMPTTTPNQKISQVKFFGGEQVVVKLEGDTFDAAAGAAKAYGLANKMVFIDPFDDPKIIAGQGSIAVEIFQDAQEQDLTVDYLLSAIGGGGLISGVATYTKAVSPTTEVVGVEPLGAQSMKAAFEANGPVMLEKIDTFVDGAAVKQVGELTYQQAKKYVQRLVAVDEGLVCETILELYSKQAIVAEPAGALSVAALENLKDELPGKTVVCIVSGGNNDITRMAEIEEKALIYQGLKHYFLVNFPQRPGALRELVTDVLGPTDDITRFEYTKKVNRGTGPAVIGIQLQQASDYQSLVQRMAAFDGQFLDLSQHPSLYTLLV